MTGAKEPEKQLDTFLVFNCWNRLRIKRKPERERKERYETSSRPHLPTVGVIRVKNCYSTLLCTTDISLNYQFKRD